METSEDIRCAAINFNGIIICGHRHGDCYATLKALQPNIPDEMLPDRNNQGFITSENRYVDRKEAWIIAKANNQIKYGQEASENGENSILISENLY